MNKRAYINKSVLLAAVMSLAFAISSCKKNDPMEPAPPVDSTKTPGTGTRAELTKDSIFLYAKEIYLWNDALPSYGAFDPRKYTSKGNDLDNYNAELFAITQIPINPTTGKPYEYSGPTSTRPKYSFIDDITDNNAAQSFVVKEKASVELDGSGYDLGFLWFEPYGESNSNFSFYVTGVYPNSPAAKAGITRGAIINKVNGRSIGTNYSSQYLLVYDLVEADPTTATISGIKTDGTPFNDVVLTKTKYTTSPVFKAKTLTVGNKKIGYLALGQFSQLEKITKPDLDAAFEQFAKDNVADLIIDLRYNGGGFVNTAQYLINLIAPPTVTGTMFVEYYNKTMQDGKASILKNQPLLDENDQIQYSGGKIVTYADVDYSVKGNTIAFSKKGSLSTVANVVFLVSGNTASASELVINSLKPHLNVKLVGKQTYGKPVGFFPIKLEKKYDVYLSLFESKNSLNQSDYYAGFTPDLVDRNTDTNVDATLYDDAKHDFGDASESYTKAALSLLVPGAVVTKANAVMSIRGKTVSVASSLNITKEAKPAKQFVGMIETRHNLK